MCACAPTRLRFSDFNQDPPEITEFDPQALGLPSDAVPAPSLRRAYEAADYRVQDYPHDFVIKIGQPCKPVDALCWDYSLASAIFITACNPRSQKLGERENQLAQARLRQRLEELNAVAVLQGAGVDPAGGWPLEPSFLALGLSLDAGEESGSGVWAEWIRVFGSGAGARIGDDLGCCCCIDSRTINMYGIFG